MEVLRLGFSSQMETGVGLVFLIAKLWKLSSGISDLNGTYPLSGRNCPPLFHTGFNLRKNLPSYSGEGTLRNGLKS
jgi:hypothetical protein